MARRQRSKWAKSERNHLEAPFAPFPCSMIESEAFRTLSGSALKILFHLVTVWARSGGITGNANGKLIATYEQFHRVWGMDSHTAAAALRQLKDLGFLSVDDGCAGSAGNADLKQPNLFRLTFLPAEGVPGTGSNEWRGIAPEDAKRIANKALRTPGGGPRRVRRRVTDVTDKFKIPVGGCHGFNGGLPPSEGVTCHGYVTDSPRGIIPRLYRSSPVGHEQHSPDLTVAPTPGNDAPARSAMIGPAPCEACGASIKSRRIDARFCSALCRKRAQRRRETSDHQHQQRKPAA